MFFIAISTLFLTVVKGLTAAQISFLATITDLFCILLQPLALKIIQKIGNVKAIRFGTIMLLGASLLITFGKQYWVLLIAYILYQPAFLFKKMDQVVLRSNLAYLKKEEQYIKLTNRSNIVYAVITMLIALVAGKLFAINHYLPMYLCIGICVINVLLSFCIFDTKEEKQEIEEKKENLKMKFPKIVMLTFLAYALLYSIMSIGQDKTTLFLQYNLQQYFDIGKTATYLSFIIVISRIARVLGNIAFQKLYKKWKDKVSVIFSSLIIIAFASIAIGSCLNDYGVIKFFFMTIGFDLILAIRDSFDAYASDIVLRNTLQEQQQKAVSYLQLARRIVATSINFLFSMLLLKIQLFYIILCLMFLAIISLMVNIKLYKMIQEKKEAIT